MKQIRRWSIMGRGLRSKLKIAFLLMSVIPILIFIYLISVYGLGVLGLKLQIASLIILSILFAFLGLSLIREIIEPVIRLSFEAKIIAQGDLDRKIEIRREDEIGDLGSALNQLTKRIRDNMEDLKNLSERTKQINLEVQKRIFILSSLLQISSLISEGQDMKEIFSLSVERLLQLGNSELSFLLLRENLDHLNLKASFGGMSSKLKNLKMSLQEGPIAKAVRTKSAIILDTQHQELIEDFKDWRKILGLENFLISPVSSRGEVLGILGIGNSLKEFVYSQDDKEMMDIFAKQIAIAIENDALLTRTRNLEIKDALTGLYNERFIYTRLEEEIKRAITFQRPCAFLLIKVDSFKEYRDSYGVLASEISLRKIAQVLKEAISDIDRAGRFGDYEFAVILPEKNKRQAKEKAEELRKKVEFLFKEEKEPLKRITVSISVTENPIDGINAKELISKAQELLASIEKEGKNLIRV